MPDQTLMMMETLAPQLNARLNTNDGDLGPQLNARLNTNDGDLGPTT